ncbi:MAG TPA: (2Fe-2S)-binding protein [Candidatus Babeliales bacterium]|jgi:bacterioferritin-associated ferredoxin|nr:(2Fe-2S)-binding protein [Candidatus Babeliales bacterium]
MKSPLELKPDYLVCTCMGIMYSEICTAIQEGKNSFLQLSEHLMVGQGCSSCVEEIKEILDNMLNS